MAIAIVIAAAISVGCSRNGDAMDESPGGSSRTADRDATFVKSLERNQGIIIDEDAAVAMAHGGCEAPMAGVGLYNAQRQLHDRYPEYDVNTVAMVMAQGVLMYCPEQLP